MGCCAGGTLGRGTSGDHSGLQPSGSLPPAGPTPNPTPPPARPHRHPPHPAPAPQAFKGLWRIQPFPPPGPRPGAPGQPAAAAAAAAAPSCRLSYSLFVRPQPWLPVHLVERRIRAEICANLAAVRAHVQGVARRRAPRPGPP